MNSISVIPIEEFLVEVMEEVTRNKANILITNTKNNSYNTNIFNENVFE